MPFADDIFGDLAAGSPLSQEEMARIVARAERRARYGREPSGVTEMRQRAAHQAALAAQINEALRSGDVVSARALVAEAEQLFGRASMVDAVQLAARQDQEDRMAEHHQAHDNGYDHDHWGFEEEV